MAPPTEKPTVGMLLIFGESQLKFRLSTKTDVPKPNRVSKMKTIEKVSPLLKNNPPPAHAVEIGARDFLSVLLGFPNSSLVRSQSLVSCVRDWKKKLVESRARTFLVQNYNSEKKHASNFVAIQFRLSTSVLQA
jgi:hypothetical protein